MGRWVSMVPASPSRTARSAPSTSILMARGARFRVVAAADLDLDLEKRCFEPAVAREAGELAPGLFFQDRGAGGDGEAAHDGDEDRHGGGRGAEPVAAKLEPGADEAADAGEFGPEGWQEVRTR